MNIEDSKAKTIFRREYDGKVFYSMGISHKKQDGTYENGYINVRFPKETNIPDKTKIMILQGWIDFYLKDKITNLYVFINKYEIVQSEVPHNIKTVYQDTETAINISDEDLPF